MNWTCSKKPFSTRLEENERDAYFIQHSAQVFGGNSGGPLLTRTGTVLGINTWIRNEVIRDEKGKVLHVGAKIGFNFALSLLQLRREIDAHAPGVVWRGLAE